MKFKLLLASLLATIPAHLLLADNSVTPGKVGTVTISLTLTSEQNGFGECDTRVITDTATSYKEEAKVTLVKRKYSNTEFITDLIARYELPGVAADWSIKYVEAYGGEFKYFFLLKKSGQIQPIGSANGYYDDSSNSSLMRMDNMMGEIPSFYGYNETTTHVRSNYTPVSGNTYGTYTREGYSYFLLSPASETGLILLGRASESGTEKTTYVFEGESQYNTSNTYTVGAASYTEIIGLNGLMGEGGLNVLAAGSIKITALLNTANVQNYLNAIRPPS